MSAPTSKLDLLRLYATRTHFEAARPRGDKLFKAVAHDVAQHKQYRKGKGIATDDDAAYLEVRRAAIDGAATLVNEAAAAQPDAHTDSDPRHTRLAAQNERLYSALQAMTASRDQTELARSELEEQLTEIVAENDRLTQLLQQYGHAQPCVVPPSQRLLTAYFNKRASSRAVLRPTKKRRRSRMA